MVVHTSGISQAQAGGSVDKILNVNLLGTAYVMDAFLPYVGPSCSLICVLSIAAHMQSVYEAPIPALLRHLTTGPASQLLEYETSKKLKIDHAGKAYCISKRANNLRVKGFAKAIKALASIASLPHAS